MEKQAQRPAQSLSDETVLATNDEEQNEALAIGEDQNAGEVRADDTAQGDEVAQDDENGDDGENTLSTEEIATADDTQAGQTLLEERSAITLEKHEDEIVFTNAMTFHAIDSSGWNIQEQTDRLTIRHYSTGESWNQAEEKDNISAEQSVLLSGGICSKQDDGTIVIEGTEDRPLWLNIGELDEGHDLHQGVCVMYQGAFPAEITDKLEAPAWWLVGGAALTAAIITACLITAVRKLRHHGGGKEVSPSRVRYGQLQNIGKRPSQQDSMAVAEINGGLLAIVADGMGGLKNGDLVSKKAVQVFCTEGRRLNANQLRGNLMPLVCRVNDEVNRLLGPTGQYKSGSTMVAALAELQQFSWISVGDSRIYLYRAGKLLQLNREHNYEADLLMRAVNHEISFQEAWGNPKKKSVSSFIGMGNLKYVDEMQRPIRTIKGDRFLLCSDGVFNTVSDEEIEFILADNQDPELAAQKLEAAVLQGANVHQDNFSAVILCYE